MRRAGRLRLWRYCHRGVERQVNLTWNAVTNATSYDVKRSITNGGPYTTIATGITATNYTDTGVSVCAGCYYVVSAMVGGSETADGPQAALSFPKLAGGTIGTPGSWNNSGDTIANVFDGDLTTFFDAPDPGSGDWVGLDFGASVSNVITQINYCPRSGFESRMVGGIFQGANQSAFSGAVTLCTITNQPATGVYTAAGIANKSAFRYVRYLSPNGGYGNVAELQFYGYPLGPDQVLNSPQMGVALTGTNLTISWPQASAGFTLQSCTNLASGNWLAVTSSAPQIVGGQWQVPLPQPTNGCAFYRLSK